MKKETEIPQTTIPESWKPTQVLVPKGSSESAYVYSYNDGTRFMYDDTLRLTSELTGKTFRVSKDTVAVGRSKINCDLVLSSIYAARLHAFFYHEGVTWFLMDNGAMNGTFLNGERLDARKKYELVQNDRIRFADGETFIFEKTTGYDERSEPEEDVKAGKIIGGKYAIEKALEGASSASACYLAREQKTQKLWVVKVYRKSVCVDSRVLDGVKRVYQRIAQLKHPMIPVVAEILESEQNLYIVWEYLEGEILEHLLHREGTQPAQKVTQWGAQLCDVLGYLHGLSEPVIHLNVCPSNILLMRDGTLRLLRLEDAYWVGVPEMKGWNKVFAESAGYAAPEEFGGMGGVDARSDIYELGATLYRLVTGSQPNFPPYEIIPIRKFDSKHPKQLEYVISKATRRNPADRYQTCEEMVRDLEKRSIWNRLFK